MSVWGGRIANDLLLCSRFLVKSLSVFILFFLHCGTQAFSSCVSRGFSRVAVHRLLVVGAVLPMGRSRPSWKFSQNRIGGFLEGAEVLWAWRRQRGPFLLGEQEKGVPIKKVLPERHGDWRPLTVFQKWPWMRSSWWEAQPSSEGPFGYLGHLRSSSCLCHS